MSLVSCQTRTSVNHPIRRYPKSSTDTASGVRTDAIELPKSELCSSSFFFHRKELKARATNANCFNECFLAKFCCSILWIRGQQTVFTADRTTEQITNTDNTIILVSVHHNVSRSTCFYQTYLSGPQFGDPCLRRTQFCCALHRATHIRKSRCRDCCVCHGH